MREARILLPAGHGEARALLAQSLVQRFGGFTVTPCDGTWRAPDGEVINELGEAFDVACNDDAPSLLALRTIADTIGHSAGQRAVYLRLPDGTVEIRPTA